MKLFQAIKPFFRAIKPLFPALILSITASFMFFIFEPIILYTSNVNDFWFDLYDMLPLLLPAFAISSVVIFLVFTFIYAFLAKLIGKPNLYYYFLAIIFCIFVITYIQGNFLSGNLPSLNGVPFSWRDFPTDTAISIGLWLVVFLVTLIAIIKFKVIKFVKIIPWITGAIFIMLAISLTSTLITTADSSLEDKNDTIATFNHYNDASTNKNFFIFLVDTVSSQVFSDVLKDNPDYQETFKDFTYFADTTSYYPHTLNSIPQILTQTPNYNETKFSEYSKNAYANSKLFQTLKDEDYQMSLFETSAILDGKTANSFANMSTTNSIDVDAFFSEFFRYTFFKYAPYPLKGHAHIEESDFSASTPDNNNLEGYGASDVENDEHINGNPVNLLEDNVFHFIHIEGAHTPHNLDENLNVIDPNIGTYEQKIGATFRVIRDYINYLKKSDVYDNSVIIILSDHGGSVTDDENASHETQILARFNPILYIKGINESHTKIITSDKPISFTDLNDAYDELLQGKLSTELFHDISYPRTREVLYYPDFDQAERLEKYMTSGPAWDTSQMKPTGEEFILESD